jgi:hypothetical protein
MPLGLVAQPVEQRIENPCVGGSIPPRATKNSKQKPTYAGRFFVFGRPKSATFIPKVDPLLGEAKFLWYTF